MLMSQQDRLRADLESLASRYGRDRTALIPILQKVQEKYHYVSDFAMQNIADILNIHPVEVYGVVTFYAFLNSKYHGKFVVRLCRTISCDMANTSGVARQLENDLGIKFGETTPDGLFTLEYANCLGMCDQGPALLVNDQIFTRVTPELAFKVIESCRRAISAHAVQKDHGELI